MNLSGNRVLITGGATGIGLAMAEAAAGKEGSRRRAQGLTGADIAYLCQDAVCFSNDTNDIAIARHHFMGPQSTADLLTH